MRSNQLADYLFGAIPVSLPSTFSILHVLKIFHVVPAFTTPLSRVISPALNVAFIVCCGDISRLLCCDRWRETQFTGGYFPPDHYSMDGKPIKVVEVPFKVVTRRRKTSA